MYKEIKLTQYSFSTENNFKTMIKIHFLTCTEVNKSFFRSKSSNETLKENKETIKKYDRTPKFILRIQYFTFFLRDFIFKKTLF